MSNSTDSSVSCNSEDDFSSIPGTNNSFNNNIVSTLVPFIGIGDDTQAYHLNSDSSARGSADDVALHFPTVDLLGGDMSSPPDMGAIQYDAGISVAPFTVSTSAYDFGTADLNSTTQSTNLRITNASSGSRTLASISLTGDSEFTLNTEPSGLYPCNGLTDIVLEPQGFCEVSVSFNPTTVDSFSGLITFASTSTNDTSATITLTAVGDDFAPSAPSAVSADTDAHDVHLTWINPTVNDFNSITIKRSDSAYPANVSEGTLIVANLTEASYTDVTSIDGTYYYSVFAKDNGGNYSEAAQVLVMIDTTAPSAPANFTDEIMNDHDVTLSWENPTSDFDSVTLVRGTSTYPASIEEGTRLLTDSPDTQYQDLDLSDGTYYYSLFAKDAVGNYSTAAQVVLTVSTPETPTETSSELAVGIKGPSNLEDIQINDEVAFTVTITNSGNGDASDSVLTLTLSDNLQFVSAEIVDTTSASASTYLKATQSNLLDCTDNQEVTCDLGTIPSDTSLVVQVTVKVAAEGKLTLDAVIQSADSTGSGSTKNPVEVGGGSTTTQSAVSSGCSLQSNAVLHSSNLLGATSLLLWMATWFVVRRRMGRS